MKNIHILPTENPSSLFEIDGHLIINKEQLIQPKYYRNIYITNDEDINENDYIITKDGRLVQVSYLLSKDLEEASKVILTTDHDLFKDGVQAINDEFHDWFVKNPSCESVETYSLGIENSDTGESGHYKYEIIIPQEETKQEQKQHLIDLMRLDEEQQILEEAAENYSIIHGEKYEVKGELHFVNTFNDIENAFIAGAEWQAKQMYSEEEVRNIANWAFGFYRRNDLSDSELEDEFNRVLAERFKKK
jgi:hypothetical protein